MLHIIDLWRWLNKNIYKISVFHNKLRFTSTFQRSRVYRKNDIHPNEMNNSYSDRNKIALVASETRLLRAPNYDATVEIQNTYDKYGKCECGYFGKSS